MYGKSRCRRRQPKKEFLYFLNWTKKVDFEEINSVQNSSHSITIFSARTLFNLLFFYMFFSLFFTNQKHFKIHKLFPALISTPLNLKNLLYFFIPYTLSLFLSRYTNHSVYLTNNNCFLDLGNETLVAERTQACNN